MNMGKIFAGVIVISAVVAGAALYYSQVYAYYEEVKSDAVEIRLVSLISGAPEPILAEDFEGIDAASSPLRFRGCFTTSQSQAMLTETYETYEAAEPLTGPGWFHCYDAVKVGEALETGDAIAFLSEPEIHSGVDRVIAIFPDGRGFIWHQLNDTYKE